MCMSRVIRLFNSAVPKMLKRMGIHSKFIHVVTDLVSGHVMHYDDTADFVIVPTEEARRDAIANHVPIEKIAVCGQPVLPDFRQRMMNGRATLRAELGFDERPILLLMGGGDGMGRIEAIARELMLNTFPNQLPQIQIQTQPQLQVQLQPAPAAGFAVGGGVRAQRAVARTSGIGKCQHPHPHFWLCKKCARADGRCRYSGDEGRAEHHLRRLYCRAAHYFV